MREPQIQSSPFKVVNNKNINLINYDDFSVKEDNSISKKENILDKNQEPLFEVETDKDEIDKILNLNNKVKDLKEKSYNFNYNNLNQGNNLNEFSNNHSKKETIDINDIPKILGKDTKKSNYSNNENEINNINFYENKNKNNYIDINELKNENEKLKQENNSLKNEINISLKKLNVFKLNKNNDKQIESKLQDLQNKIEIYESSLESTRKQYESQLLNYQKEINNLNCFVNNINKFFNNISNKYVILNLNYKILNISILENNLNEIEKYIYNLNKEIEKYKSQNQYNNFKNEEDYITFTKKEGINNNINKHNIIKYNLPYNSLTGKKVNLKDNIINNNENCQLNLEDVNNDNINFRMLNNNELNIDYKTLEQRVRMLEKKLMEEHNIFNDLKSFKRDINNFPYNTQKNSIFFKNDILSEKVRPLSVKSSSNNIKFYSNEKIQQKKKRKTRMKYIGGEEKYDCAYTIKNKTFTNTNINKGKINKKINKKYK